MKRFAEYSTGRDNNFNLIRVLAAGGVLVSHSWPIIDPRSAEPLENMIGLSLGHVCVLLFFAISGFFITKSYERANSLTDFLWARAARLFPALVVVIVLTVLVAGPLLTRHGTLAYFSNPQIYAYLLQNVAIVFGQIYELPGVLGDRPINGSLWTLRYEVYCYASVVLLGLLGCIAPRRYWLWLGLVLLIAVAAALVDKGTGISRLLLAFALGGGVYVYRNAIPFSGFIAAVLLAAALLIRETPLFGVLFCVACAYAILWLGFARIPFLTVYNRFGDISYGLYIYAFPVQMIWAYEGGIANPYVLMAVSFATTLPLAIASWLLVEKPALDMRRRIFRGRGNERLPA